MKFQNVLSSWMHFQTLNWIIYFYSKICNHVHYMKSLTNNFCNSQFAVIGTVINILFF